MTIQTQPLSSASSPIVSRYRVLVLWAVIGIWWLLYLLVVFAIYTNHPQGAGDFSYYYRGALRLLDGVPLYTNLVSSDYVGPMLVIQGIAPIVAVANRSQTASELIWWWINLAAIASSLVIMSGHLHSRRTRMILWAVSPLFIPLLYSLWLGQLTVIMFAFTVAAWSAYKHDKPVLTGVLLAIIVWTKFYPGLLIIYFLWKREWRVVISAGAATVILVLIQSAAQGFETFLSYYTNVLPELVAIGQPQLNHSNNALLGFAQKLFSPSLQIIPLVDSPLLLSIIRYGLTLLLLGTLFYRTRHAFMNTSSQRFDLEFSLALIVALLLGSTLGLHGMLSILLPMVVLMQTTASRGRNWKSRRQMVLGLMLVVALINIHLFIILGYLRPPSTITMSALLLSLPFFGIMLLWGFTMNALNQVNPKPMADAPESASYPVESA